MAKKTKFGFGPSENVDNALQQGLINARDILLLDENTNNPKIGWISSDGEKVIIEDKEQIVRVDELPVADGDKNVVYIYNNEGYIWDGEKCVSISKQADLTLLEDQMANLETKVEQKVDATEVQNMIQEYYEATYEIVEF